MLTMPRQAIVLFIRYINPFNPAHLSQYSSYHDATIRITISLNPIAPAYSSHLTVFNKSSVLKRENGRALTFYSLETT